MRQNDSTNTTAGEGLDALDSTRNRLTFEVSIDSMSFAASGDAALVFKAWNEFQQTVISNDARLRAIQEQRPQPAKRTSLGGTDTSAEDEPLAVYLERYPNLDSNPKIGLAIIAWAKRHLSLDSLGPTDVKRLWRDTNYPVPSNVPRELANAVKPGWLVRTGNGRYGLSGFGERFLESQAA